MVQMIPFKYPILFNTNLNQTYIDRSFNRLFFNNSATLFIIDCSIFFFILFPNNLLVIIIENDKLRVLTEI